MPLQIKKSSPAASRRRARAATKRSAAASVSTRGRPPKKVFINVLVRESTRSGLAKLKMAADLDSQGEVIDRLVADVISRKPARGR
jgi:hypothetical protein